MMLGTILMFGSASFGAKPKPTYAVQNLRESLRAKFNSNALSEEELNEMTKSGTDVEKRAAYQLLLDIKAAKAAAAADGVAKNTIKNKESPAEFNLRKAAADVRAAFAADKAASTGETQKNLRAAQAALESATAAVNDEERNADVARTPRSSKPLPMTPTERATLDATNKATEEKVKAETARAARKADDDAAKKKASRSFKELAAEQAEALKSKSRSAKNNLASAKAALKATIDDQKKGKTVFDANGNEVTDHEARITAAKTALADAAKEKAEIDQAVKKARTAAISNAVSNAANTVKTAARKAVGLPAENESNKRVPVVTPHAH
jgi:hypothetical protein